MAGRIRFGEFELDLDSGELEKGGERTRLQELPFKLLKALLTRSGEVVTREELIAALWPGGVVVDFDTGLNSAVRKLRAALGDDADTPRYVETLPRRGYRFIQAVAAPVEAARAAAITTEPRPSAKARFQVGARLRWLAVILVTLLATALIALRQDTPPTAAPADAALADAALAERSIAVLPFQALGEPGAAGFLARGISESILQKLTLLPNAMVISRSSSFSPLARADDPQGLGKLLHARYLLSGTVQRQGNSLRVIATLLESSTAVQVWSAQFDRPVGDVFAVQDEIASQVARAMRISLDATAAARLAARGTANIDAYLEYLQARSLHDTLVHSDLQQAEAHYRRAMDLDPGFSSAYSALAVTLADTGSYHWDQQVDAARQRKDEARALAGRALALDRNNADAHLVLARLAASDEEAAPLIHKALSLDPNLAEAHARQAELDMSAAFGDAPHRAGDFFRHIDRAIELDPLQPHYLVEKMWGVFTMRPDRMGEAEALLQQALRINPDYFPALTRIGELRWCCQQRLADALPYLERALAIDPTSTTTAMLLIQVYSSVGDLASAQALQRQFPHSTEGAAIIAVRRHQWQSAARILDEQIERRNVAGASSNGPLVLAVRMRAYETGDFASVQRYIADVLRPGEAEGHIAPRMGTFYSPEIVYAETLRAAAEQPRRRQILEQVLHAMDRTSIEFQRGEFWFPLWRARALALLGRDEEALFQLERLPAISRTGTLWEATVDPVFDRLRAEPRFVALLARLAGYEAAERARIDELRDRGVIPRRG
ncbi:MAG: winged helix-turn-helix domain-containing protein [Steroidobacteraceae bacterium]